MRADEGASTGDDSAAATLPTHAASHLGFFSSAGSRSGAPQMHLQDRNTEALRSPSRRAAPPRCISSGFTFEGDSQRLVSIQKPLGLLLEELDELEPCGVVVAGVAPDSNADRAGVLAGDRLVAVGNLDVSAASVDSVTEAITNIPGRVVNLRFLTAASSGT